MSKHTPGPWRANASWIEGPAMALRVAAVDWPKTTPGSAPRDVEEARANARLIAAAPELLEALGSILSPDVFHVAVNGVEMGNDRLREIIGNIYETARVAIAKAEGRS